MNGVCPGDGEEILPIVDENDIEVGTARRSEIHRRAWRHRAVHIVVYNSRGQVLLQRRGLLKDTYPGYWDVSVGGHVGAGESYGDAAAREIREELGIEASLTRLEKIPACAQTGWEFVELFSCLHEGPFSPPPEEISELQWIDAGEVLHRAALDRNWPIARSGVNSIRLWHEARLPKAKESGNGDPRPLMNSIPMPDYE
jgi:isopentenyl-diphosphate delta-isomerase type 1